MFTRKVYTVEYTNATHVIQLILYFRAQSHILDCSTHFKLYEFLLILLPNTRNPAGLYHGINSYIYL